MGSKLLIFQNCTHRDIGDLKQLTKYTLNQIETKMHKSGGPQCTFYKGHPVVGLCTAPTMAQAKTQTTKPLWLLVMHKRLAPVWIM